MIVVVDCEIGNLRSIQKAFESRGFDASITFDLEEIERAKAIVLPGVGAFKDAIEFIRSHGLEPVLKKAVDQGKLFLGICLGLQLMMSQSEEGGLRQGLGFIEGGVVRFSDSVKVPQMGWNRIKRKKTLPIFEGVPEDAYFYFAHSYYVVPSDDGVVGATTDYGIEYASVVYRGSLFGVQFHPEKSGAVGLKILENFANLACG